MALINIKISSVELQAGTVITVVYPDLAINKQKEVNVLFLLHGYSGNNYDWTRYTNLEKIVAEKNLMVVMPDGDNSFYTNSIAGFNYFDFLTKELPQTIENIFKIKLTKENTYIVGLSMGGYGALKAALTYPNKYQGVASLSGTTNIKDIHERLGDRVKVIESIFGTKEHLDKNLEIHELTILTKNLEKEKLDIYLACGTEDFLYQDNLKFKDHLELNNIPYVFKTRAGGHSWDYWGFEIISVINHFFGVSK